PHARRPVRRRLCTMPDRSPGEACMAQTLALVTLLVHDYDEALDWFVGRLGFVPVEDRPVPEQGKRWVVIAPPGGRPGCRLLLARASTPDQQALVGRQLGGRVGFFLETDDLARDHARWQAAGVRFLEAPRREPYGEVVVFADCYGNRWDLLQPAPGHARATPPSLDGVRSGYDRWAAVYDHDANPLLALEESTLRAALGAVAGLDPARPRHRHRAPCTVGGGRRRARHRTRFLGGHAGAGARQVGRRPGAFPRARPAAAAAVRRRLLRPRGERTGAGAPRGTRRVLRRGPARAAAGRPRGGERHAPGDVPARQPGPFHRSRQRAGGAAGQRRAFGGGVRDGGAARRFRRPRDRRACGRRGTGGARPARGALRRLAHAGAARSGAPGRIRTCDP